MFEVKFNTTGATFEPPIEVDIAVTLSSVSSSVYNGDVDIHDGHWHNIRDINGNKIGAFRYTKEDK